MKAICLNYDRWEIKWAAFDEVEWLSDAPGNSHGRCIAKTNWWKEIQE